MVSSLRCLLLLAIVGTVVYLSVTSAGGTLCNQLQDQSPRILPHSETPNDSIDPQHILDNDGSDIRYYDDKAFVTLIANVSMLEPARVSVKSLKDNTQAVIVVLSALPVDERVVNLFEGVQILQASLPLQVDDYPNWKQYLSRYRRVVYFSPEVLFKDNVDHYLGYVAGTTLQNEQGQIGLRVLDFDAKHPPLVHETFPVGQELEWFDSPMKPWNFHLYRSKDWEAHYRPLPFYHWRQLYDELHYENKKTDQVWKNRERRDAVCNAPALHTTTSVADTTRFSVLLSTYNPERIAHLTRLVEHLLQSPLLDTLYITWHNPKLPIPDTLLGLEKEGRLRVLGQAYDSLNNRFNPIPFITTEAVYILDDDIFVEVEDIEFTFKVWQLNKDSIVGHFPRIHNYNPEMHEASYRVARSNNYSMILTKSMFVRTDYLFTYTCLLDLSLHKIIDEMLNCEDIAFNMMVSGLSGAPPVAVIPNKPMLDFGRKNGISTNSQHMGYRSECVAKFINEHWDAQDPLVVSHAAAVPYSPPTIVEGNWNHIDADVEHTFQELSDVAS